MSAALRSVLPLFTRERQAREHTRYCFPPRLFGLDILLDAPMAEIRYTAT